MAAELLFAGCACCGFFRSFPGCCRYIVEKASVLLLLQRLMYIVSCYVAAKFFYYIFFFFLFDIIIYVGIEASLNNAREAGILY